MESQHFGPARPTKILSLHVLIVLLFVCISVLSYMFLFM